MKLRNTIVASLAIGLLASVLPASAAPHMIHRWSFNETSGTTVADSVGSQDGTLKQNVTNGVPQGALPTLDGVEVTMDGVGGYVDLGNGVFSGLTNTTVEIWFRGLDLGTNATWANLLCAGAITTTGIGGQDGTPLEDTNGTLRNGNNGTNYYGADGLFFTPRSGAGGNPGRFAISDDTNATFNYENPQLETLAAMDDDITLGGFPNYVAITYGPDGQRLFNFHLEQESAAVQPPDYISLSEINDINIFLGRSLYGGDPMLNASVNEVRVHDTILSAPEIAASYFAGYSDPNIVSYDPGTLSALTAVGSINPNMFQDELQRAAVTATFGNIGDIPIYPPDLDYMSSSDTNVIQIVNSDIEAVGGGDATISFGLNGISNSIIITVTATTPILNHRWSFAGDYTDSVGGATGVPQGNATVSGGQLVLDGTAGTYMNIPGAPSGVVIPTYTNLSVEVWCTPDPTTATWSTVVGFGKTNASDSGLMGKYFILQTHRGDDVSRAAISYSDAGGPWGAESGANGPEYNDNQQHHYVGIIGPSRVQLYVDGILEGETTLSDSNHLYNLSDEFGRIGFGYPVDGVWKGEVTELRIYDGVMTPLNIALNIAAGPDAIPPDPGALLSVDVVSDDLMIGDPNTTPACLCATFENISGVNLISVGGSLASSDTNIITVDANGNLTGVGTNGESATISGTYFTETVNSQIVTILAPTGLSMNVTSPLVAGDLSVSAGLTADFPSASLQNQDVTAFNGIVWSSSNPDAASVSANGQVTPNGPGTAEIVATYGGISATGMVTVTVDPGHAAPTLLHRYSFSEAPDSTIVPDSVGGADGTVVGLVAASTNNNYNGSGQLVMAGSGDSITPLSAYVNLPNNMVSVLSAVTFEGWITDRAPANNWERWYDFGMSSGDIDTNTVPPTYNEDSVANPGRAYAFLARVGTGTDLRFAYKEAEDAETGATASGAISPNTYYHFAVTIDPVNQGVASLYLNGERVAATATSLALSVLDDRNAWLGRSQWGDGMLAASYDEFRIWDGALLGADVLAAYAAGPNAVITPIAGAPELSMSISGDGSNVTLSWPTNGSSGFLLEAAHEIDGTYSSAGLPTPSVVGDQNQVTVPQTNDMRYFRLAD